MPSSSASLQMTAGILILLASTMVAIEGSSSCKNDADCPENQYCYETSFTCVNYTVCSWYNRQKGNKHARNPSQCGPCMPGYIAEVLATGEQAPSCRIIIDNTEEGGSKNASKLVQTWIITTIAIFCIGAAIILFYLIRKRGTSLMKSYTRTDSCKRWGDMCNFGPSAPPLESGVLHGVFTEIDKKAIYSTQVNNNKNLTNRNKLVTATPFKEPSWVQVNPNYEQQQFNNESQNVPEQRTLPAIELPPEEDTNPSSWTPEQTTVQLPSRPFLQFSTEQRDNAINSRQLIPDNCPGTSSYNENNHGPSSESSSAQNDSDHVRATNILISQKITMNLNVRNGDY